MWQAFIRALDRLTDAYGALLALAEKKRAALVAVDMKALGALVEEEKSILERIGAAESERRGALLALAGATPALTADVTMAGTEAACPAAIRERLRGAHRRLSRSVAQAREAGETNEFLIRHARAAVEYHLNRFANSSVDPTYGSRGQERVTREKKFDFQA